MITEGVSGIMPANVAINVGDTRAGATTQRVRVNTKRAFECSGTNC